MKDIRQARFIYSHIAHSSNSSKGSMTSLRPKHRHHHPVIVPTHAATSRMKPSPMGSTSSHTRKQSTPSRLVRHIRRGSCPLPSGSRFRKLFQQKTNRAQNAAVTGRDPSESRGVWVSTLMVQVPIGVILRIQPQRRLWGLSRTSPAIVLTP